jgi:hypothetical protein
MDNSGPAFGHGAENGHCCGMTVRDYLAAAVLNGILASQAHPQSSGTVPVDRNSALFYALNAYKYADAMLEVRGPIG